MIEHPCSVFPANNTNKPMRESEKPKRIEGKKLNTERNRVSIAKQGEILKKITEYL